MLTLLSSSTQDHGGGVVTVLFVKFDSYEVNLTANVIVPGDITNMAENAQLEAAQSEIYKKLYAGKYQNEEIAEIKKDLNALKKQFNMGVQHDAGRI